MSSMYLTRHHVMRLETSINVPLNMCNSKIKSHVHMTNLQLVVSDPKMFYLNLRSNLDGGLKPVAF